MGKNGRPLSELRGLGVLLLDGNEVADLAPLWGLTGFAHLGLGDSRVAEAALLSDLRSLRDVSALGELPQLVWLRLVGNPVADLSSLGRLPGVHGPMLDGRTSRTDVVARDNVDRRRSLLTETTDGRESGGRLDPAPW